MLYLFKSLSTFMHTCFILDSTMQIRLIRDKYDKRKVIITDTKPIIIAISVYRSFMSQLLTV
ncbi:MAG: hypothetical protein SYNGOMJ08_00373 [Candidatus Syntrophoarchaeum sp. GoM_oil]|nr:MAG: hypothetical protein SYNGOMJ08_00373 [Candidatus Syntrophoarchaeum sp. GoM_oil]